MDFLSTRGAAPTVGFLDALLGGLAPDGGLYMPAAWPRLPAVEIAGLAGAPYASVASAVVGRFVGSAIDARDLAAICERAYAPFDHPAVTPLSEIAPGRFLLELFHGPSLAFKDIAMRLLAELYRHVLKASGRRLTLVCATSGDTGGAAAAAFAGARSLRCIILYPKGRISEAQRRFITATGAENIAALAVAGDFDDCQGLVKRLLADRRLAAEVGLTAVNSINIVRILAQCVYYFVAAAALRDFERPPRFVVPTGNLGDAFAGWAARAMGLPIASIRLATNRNDILARVLGGGGYAPGAAHATLSPAMDIQAPSNFERLYFECAERDGQAVARAFAALGARGALALPDDVLGRMRAVVDAEAVNDEQTEAAMAATWRHGGILIDPHTAAAVAAASRPAGRGEAGDPIVILATAHPAKFPQTVAKATGQTPAAPPRLATLMARPERIQSVGADLDEVRAFVESFARS